MQPEPEPEPEVEVDAEQESVWKNRRKRFEQLGYQRPVARLLAESEADLHLAERLAAEGCPLNTLLHILL